MPHSSLDLSSALLICDRMQTVARRLPAGPEAAFGHTVFGHRLPVLDPGKKVSFAGQLLEPEGWYLLGNGYRAYNPQLRRFQGPDSLSPFDGGGLNAYAYCEADPVNRHDPSGHEGEEYWIPAASLLTLFVGGIGIGAARRAYRAALKKQALLDYRVTSRLKKGFVADRFRPEYLQHNVQVISAPFTAKPSILKTTQSHNLPKAVSLGPQTFNPSQNISFAPPSPVMRYASEGGNSPSAPQTYVRYRAELVTTRLANKQLRAAAIKKVEDGALALLKANSAKLGIRPGS